MELSTIIDAILGTFTIALMIAGLVQNKRLAEISSQNQALKDQLDQQQSRINAHELSKLRIDFIGKIEKYNDRSELIIRNVGQKTAYHLKITAITNPELENYITVGSDLIRQALKPNEEYRQTFYPDLDMPEGLASIKVEYRESNLEYIPPDGSPKSGRFSMIEIYF